MKSVQTTFTVDSKIWSSFQHFVDQLQLRRDRFLSNVLPDEIHSLSMIAANSEKGGRYLRENSGLSSVWEIDGVSPVKVNLNLDKEIVQDMNTVCNEKNVPRDVFMNDFLRFLVHGAANGFCGSPLAIASDLITNPRSQYVFNDGERSYYEDLSVTDEFVGAQERQHSELLRLAEAVSRVRGISVYAAQKALHAHTAEERAKIERHPDIVSAMKVIEGGADEKIDFSDLLIDKGAKNSND